MSKSSQTAAYNRFIKWENAQILAGKILNRAEWFRSSLTLAYNRRHTLNAISKMKLELMELEKALKTGE